MPDGQPITVEYLSTPRPLAEELAGDVATGLVGADKRLPPKYFYDARGSKLFEEITRLPEYYLTRAEAAVLDREADGILRRVRPREIVELGSGSSRKTRLLLEAMHRVGSGDRYVPLDISEAAVRDAGETLVERYPWLRVRGCVGDFHSDLGALPRHGTRLLAFLGSTIGNLLPDERAGLLEHVAATLGAGDRLLLGADLVKDPDTLLAAYDDAAGVTAEFNRNMLRVVNRELDGDLPVDAFEHRARWNAEAERVEILLVASREVEARLAAIDLPVRFAAGEELLTEYSCKFRIPALDDELAAAGLDVEAVHTDDDERLAVVLAR